MKAKKDLAEAKKLVTMYISKFNIVVSWAEYKIKENNNVLFLFQESEQRSSDAQLRGQLEILTQQAEEHKVFLDIYV